VKLNPPPWFVKWEQRDLKGIEPIEDMHWKRRRILRKIIQPMHDRERYDIMKEYRRCIPEEDQEEIWKEVDQYRVKFPVRKQMWKRTLQKAKPKTKSK
ncbi:39S ribosomal protein L19, mitochondrial, partial [Caerostris extrusa]